MFGLSRTRSRRRVAAAIAAVTAVGAAALATTGVSSATVAAQSQGKIDKSAILKMGVGIADNGGSALDPASPQNINPYNGMWMDLIYDVMIHDTTDGKGAPGLAAKWSTPDPSTVELVLQPNVKFSDGSPFNAAAVKGAWDRMLAANLPLLYANLKAITNVEAVNDNTIRLHLNKPIAQTLIDQELHHSFFLGVPSPAAIAEGNLNTKPVGAGPYTATGYTKDQRLTLAKNETYWNPKAQLLGGVEFVQASAGQPAVSALQAGTVDLIWSIPPDSFETIKSTPGLTVTAKPGSRVFDIGLCATNGVFASKEARQAIQYAVDREAISNGAWAGIAPPAQTVLTPASPYYDKKLDSTYTYNPKKAKALLKKAGVAPGTTISGLSPNAIPQPTIAEIVQSQLKDVGLNLEYQVSTDFVNDANTRKPDMLFVSFDPSLWGPAFSGSQSALNICAWKNDQVIADTTTMSDGSKTEAEKRAAAERFNKTIHDESPDIFTTLGPLTSAHTTNVKGIKVITNPFGVNLETVYMTK